MRPCPIIAAIACIFLSAPAFAQNPYESIGKDVKVLTLSDGKFNEFHPNDTLRRVGSVIVNLRTKEIYQFIEQDTLYSEATLDPTIISRWYSLDPLMAKYPSISPYAFAANNPIFNTDRGGDSVWTTIERMSEIRNGQNVIIVTVTVHVRAAMLNASSSAMNMDLLTSRVQADLSSAINAVPQDIYTQDGTQTITRWRADVQIRPVNSIDEVKASDNLLVLVDKINQKTSEGKPAGGVAREGGKIGYVQNKKENYFSFSWLIDASVHEFGHQLGMSHQMVDDRIVRTGTNYMSYSSEDLSTFGATEMFQIRPSSGPRPYTFLDQVSGSTSSQTSNDQPYKGPVKAGDKIPTPIEKNY